MTSLTAYTTQVVDEFLGDKEVLLAPPVGSWKSELGAIQYLEIPNSYPYTHTRNPSRPLGQPEATTT